MNSEIADHQRAHFGEKADVNAEAQAPTGDKTADAMQKDIASYEAQEKKEAGAAQADTARKALKKEALDQGYSEEQAELYANQEMAEQAGAGATPAAAASPTPAPVTEDANIQEQIALEEQK